MRAWPSSATTRARASGECWARPRKLLYINAISKIATSCAPNTKTCHAIDSSVSTLRGGFTASGPRACPCGSTRTAATCKTRRNKVQKPQKRKPDANTCSPFGPLAHRVLRGGQFEAALAATHNTKSVMQSMRNKLRRRRSDAHDFLGLPIVVALGLLEIGHPVRGLAVIHLEKPANTAHTTANVRVGACGGKSRRSCARGATRATSNWRRTAAICP